MRYIALLLFALLSHLSYALGIQEVKLLITDDVSQEVDETTLNLDYGTGPDYNYAEDSKKILNSTLQVPQIFSITTDNINCHINSYGPFNGEQVIPLGFRNYSAGSYTISLSSIDNLDPTSIILLEDKLMGVLHHLQQGDYSFNVSSQQLLNTTRFALHVSHAAIISTELADCNNLNGKILIDQDTTVTWTQCQLFNSASELIGTQNNVTGQFSFNGLASGNYTMGFYYDGYVATRVVTLNSTQISVTIGTASQTIATGQPLQFTSNTLNTLYYDWDFGDGTIITAIANPQMIYYAPGVYTVTLRASNASGCEGFAYITINVTQGTGISNTLADKVSVFATGNTVVIKNDAALSNALYAVTSLTGQVVSSGKLENTVQSISLANQANGIYIVNITSAEGTLSRKIFAGE